MLLDINPGSIRYDAWFYSFNYIELQINMMNSVAFKNWHFRAFWCTFEIRFSFDWLCLFLLVNILTTHFQISLIGCQLKERDDRIGAALYDRVRCIRKMGKRENKAEKGKREWRGEREREIESWRGGRVGKMREEHRRDGKRGGSVSKRGGRWEMKNMRSRLIDNYIVWFVGY